MDSKGLKENYVHLIDNFARLRSFKIVVQESER